MRRGRLAALSGLRVLKMDGSISPEGLRFDSGFADEGYGIAYEATAWPGFKRFRRFCLPLAGWFRGGGIAAFGGI